MRMLLRAARIHALHHAATLRLATVNRRRSSSSTRTASSGSAACASTHRGHGNAGDRVGLWQCHGGPNQKWRFESGQLKGLNNRCMDIVQGNKENAARVILWDCHAGANQKFAS
jgi:hypothetical protein